MGGSVKWDPIKDMSDPLGTAGSVLPAMGGAEASVVGSEAVASDLGGADSSQGATNTQEEKKKKKLAGKKSGASGLQIGSAGGINTGSNGAATMRVQI